MNWIHLQKHRFTHSLVTGAWCNNYYCTSDVVWGRDLHGVQELKARKVNMLEMKCFETFGRIDKNV